MQILLAIGVGINLNNLGLFDSDKEVYGVVCAETYLLVTAAFVAVYLFDSTKQIFEFLFMFSGSVLLTVAGIVIVIECFQLQQVPMEFAVYSFLVLGSGIILTVDFIFLILNK